MKDAVADVLDGGVLDVPLGGGLELVPHRRSRWRLVATPERNRPVALQIDHDEDRCRLGLAVLGGARIVDVSRDPAAFFNALRSAADHAGQPQERWASAAGTALDRLGRTHGWWEEDRRSRLEHTGLAAAWPLLRQIELQPDDPVSLPRWAAGLCTGPDLRTAVSRVLGDRSSRRVIRLVGERLAGRPDWWPLALVLALPRLDAGQTGEVLAGIDDDFLCDDDQFALLRRTIGAVRPDVAVRLLQSVTREGNPQRLLAALDGVARARDGIERFPTTISALEMCVANALITPPPPERARPARTAASRTAGSRTAPSRGAPPRTEPSRNEPPGAQRPTAAVETGATRQVAQPHPRAMPRVADRSRSTGQFDHPPTWHHLDGAQQGDVQLRLPPAPADLNQWGFALHNCLGSYKGRVGEGRSLILGVFVRGHLVGAVEVNPSRRRLIQISATKGRPLPRTTRETVTAMLIARGAVIPPGRTA